MTSDAHDSRSCTCHPGEAPMACQRKYAFGECATAAISALATLLSEGLDLCVRARKLDEPIIATAEMCDRNPHMTRSLTPALWIIDQYEHDLADWERRTRIHLMPGYKP